mmetsp:Transcript_22592/g.62410  ORF Transcript_22592/g.62410 Transcript_22592/m.62410 type:complete len:204 (-) Transcript_22592:478-1089(-)
MLRSLITVLRVLAIQALRLGQAGAAAHHEDKEELFGTCTVGVVNHQATREAHLHCCRNHHLCLGGAVRVHLQHSPGSTVQACVKRLKKALQALPWLVAPLIRVAQPLHCADGDGPIKGASAEGQSVAEVMQRKVTLSLAFKGHIKHGRGDVSSHPYMSHVTEFLATQPRTAAQIQQHARRAIVGQAQQLHSTLCQAGLDLHDA